MSNDIQRLSPTALVALASQMTEAIGTGPTSPYGLAQSEVNA